MSAIALYELESISDNPLFRRFTYADPKSPSLLGRECRDDDLTPGFADSDDSRRWKQPSLQDSWMPLEVSGEVADYHDFPMLACMPVFSQRACSVLLDFLEPAGELLPLVSKTKMPYFFYNVTRIADVFDVENSECRFWCDPPTTTSGIDYFAFSQEKLDSLDIFRIPESPMLTIVSRRFVDRVLESGLSGFRFTKLWPLERGTNWRSPRDMIETTDIDKYALKRQTLILCFTLEGDTPDKEEREALEAIGSSLDRKLKVESLEQPYFGSYEVVSIDDGEFRMFLSTPNVESLAAHILPIIKSAEWHSGFRIIKSDGGIHDDNS